MTAHGAAKQETGARPRRRAKRRPAGERPQRGAVKACTTHAIIEIGMVRQQGPPLLLHVVLEEVHLTVDGVLLLLLLCGDAGVQRYL